MFSRLTGIPLLLGAAVAVPYFASNGSEGISKLWQTSASQSTVEPDQKRPPTATDRHTLDPPLRGPGSEVYLVDTPLEGSRSISLEDVFRFDLTKEQVYQRWARKSTALAELGLFGVRVPLVTGTQLHDLAGSLTYFFDQAGKLRKISFQGNTGDTTQLVMLVVHRFGLQPQASAIAGEQLFQVKQGTEVYSQLRTRPSAVLWSSSPHESFTVDLQLQAPGTTTPLPAQLPTLPAAAPAGEHSVQPSADHEVTPEDEAKAVAAEQRRKRKELEDKFNALFPRSRVPEQQVKNLEKRDLYW